MAEPELIITDEQTIDEQPNNEPDVELELSEEPEFELEDEEQEFSLEDEEIPPAVVEVAVAPVESAPEFNEQTLENLLTEPDIAESTIEPVGAELSESAKPELLEELEPDSVSTTEDLPEIIEATDTPEAELSTAPNSADYSDDILSFPAVNPSFNTSETESQSESAPEDKIDLSDTIEIEHKPGTLHTQQAQQIELSILERVDDLIHVLQNKSKASGSPEQLPHKQFATGLHYIKHEKNHYLGAKWLRKAAIQGHAKAQMYLGMLFVQGKGVPKSLFHAYAWFSLAVCQDIAEAIDARKKLEPHLTAKEINASLKYAADLLDRIHL